MTDCPWDLNGDGVVDDADHAWLMDHWGPCTPGSKGDFNGDGTIDISDIMILQQHYGPCPGVTPPSDCPWDLNGDGVVDDADKQWLTDHSGPCTPGSKGDFNGDGVIDIDDIIIMGQHYGPCPVVTPPPNMETRTMSLEIGKSYQIQVSLSGYDTLNATINVSPTGVTCTVGPCNTTGPPGVTTSGWTVTTYLKTGTTTDARCTWILAKDTTKVAFISDMILAHLELKSIGFTPTAAEIGDGILMYLKLTTPASKWGC